MKLKEINGNDPITHSLWASIKDIFTAAPPCHAPPFFPSSNICTLQRQKCPDISQRVSLKYIFNKQRPHFFHESDFLLGLSTVRAAHWALSAFMLLVFWLLQDIVVINLGKLALVMDSRRGLGVKQWWAMETVVSKSAAVTLKQAWTRWEEGNSQNVWRPSDGSILGESCREQSRNPTEQQLSSTCWYAVGWLLEEQRGLGGRTRKAEDELLVGKHC